MFDERDDLYDPNNDPVIVLDDGSFIGKNHKIRKNVFQGKGILKAYAPWCGHCKAKVKCMKRLGEILPEFDVQVYVINVDNNPVFQEHFKDKVRGYPTFLYVDDSGNIGDVIRDADGNQVYSVPSILAALCGNDPRICAQQDNMKDCP